MKGVVVRRQVRLDPEVEIFTRGFWAGIFVALMIFGLVCSICNVNVTLP